MKQCGSKRLSNCLFLALIVTGLLSLTAGGIVCRISSLLCCLLPMLTLALYLVYRESFTLLPPMGEKISDMFFGKTEKCSLLFHFWLSALIWLGWLVFDSGGITLLDRTKWLTLSFGISVVLSASFLVFSKEYRSHKTLAALAVVMAAANAFAFVWAVNVVCDTSPAEEYEVVVTDAHLEDNIKAGIHHEDYLTVQYEDGSLLDLYEPYDFDDYAEGERLTVRHHKGMLGIEWAEFVQPTD